MTTFEALLWLMEQSTVLLTLRICYQELAIGKCPEKVNISVIAGPRFVVESARSSKPFLYCNLFLPQRGCGSCDGRHMREEDEDRVQYKEMNANVIVAFLIRY